MTALWFVTPAWQRYELSTVCFEQRRRVIAALAEQGIEGRCVVIANDANLDIARGLGFDTVEQENFGPDGKVWLGRKFNDGFEYAGKHGAEWIVPIGSDSWIDPAYFIPLEDPRFTRTSSAYCVVEADRLAELTIGGDEADLAGRPRRGVGPYVYHRNLFRVSRFRPAPDHKSRNIDIGTVRGLRHGLRWVPRILHPFQYVGFRGQPTITAYETLVALARERPGWAVTEHADPWAILARHYPADLVERARVALATVAVAA